MYLDVFRCIHFPLTLICYVNFFRAKAKKNVIVAVIVMLILMLIGVIRECDIFEDVDTDADTHVEWSISYVAENKMK